MTGVEQAEIVEILDHHHIGSIETRVPVTATFDPVGSTATLVVERFRTNGYRAEHARPRRCCSAPCSPTPSCSTRRRRPSATAPSIDYLEALLGLDAMEFGREMFEATSDVSAPLAAEIVARDAKEYALPSGETISIAQIETVGTPLLDRREELLEAIGGVREGNGYSFAALMVTDILEQCTDLLVCRRHRPDRARLRRAQRRRRHPPTGGDEPQEAGGAGAARRPEAACGSRSPVRDRAPPLRDRLSCRSPAATSTLL